ncbi:hypothetical protein [Corynebacterium pseudopelargi]|uniref:Uncharacterized protein n=1 Tax=Corynebacterium pseudopelargi TaxID=2080757 RepID=A0A3G6IT02_9CORY|nr:hypothetical protein [Corynebacterium pseudopelargi]AZA08733.1 hypothetical protein CPPEL_03010 [Corynebacterium pseudopelargi]
MSNKLIQGHISTIANNIQKDVAKLRKLPLTAGMHRDLTTISRAAQNVERKATVKPNRIPESYRLQVNQLRVADYIRGETMELLESPLLTVPLRNAVANLHEIAIKEVARLKRVPLND